MYISKMYARQQSRVTNNSSSAQKVRLFGGMEHPVQKNKAQWYTNVIVIITDALTKNSTLKCATKTHSRFSCYYLPSRK